jgi:hypothetical protein
MKLTKVILAAPPVEPSTLMWDATAPGATPSDERLRDGRSNTMRDGDGDSRQASVDRYRWSGRYSDAR